MLAPPDAGRNGGGTVVAMGIEFTPLSSRDIDAIAELVRRWEAHWEVPMVTPRFEIEEVFGDPHLVAELDTRGAWVANRLRAVGLVQHTPSGERLERAFLVGKVDPEMRGRGIGRRLLAWQIERAAERLRTCDPGLPWCIRTHEWEWIGEAHRLFARFGLRPVRWFEELMRPLERLPEPAPPPDISIVPWDAAPSEEIRNVSNAAFADHWGSTPRDASAWEHMVGGQGMRTDLSYLAVDGDEVVGVCLNSHYPEDEAVTGRLDGWISHLGVIGSWRKRGVGEALIVRSLLAFRDAGFTHALLGVDADNPTGAAGLYRKLGFVPLHRSVTSELRIAPETG